MSEPKKNPTIGVVGLVLVSLGVVFACSGVDSVALVAAALIAVGGILVVVALATGRLKFLG